MKPSKTLQMIYDQIPTLTCIAGCTDCCGPVPFAPAERAKIKVPLEQTSIHCPYSSQGNCSIYENRPFMCRIFGATVDERLKCPHGCAPAKPLNLAKTAELTDKYVKILK